MKKLLCTILAAAMLLTLCACGGTGSKATYNDAGYYTIFSVDEGDETLTQADFESMDWTIFLQLNDDGTGVLDMDDGDVTELTWKDGTINDGSGDMPYVLAGGMLTLDLTDSDGTFVMIFKKGAAPAEAPEETGETSAAASFADRFSRTGNNDGDTAEDTAEDAEGKDEAEEDTAPADDKKPAAPTGDFTPVSGDIGDYHVEILAAEQFTDSDGKDAVRFYYDFTNNSDEVVTPNWELNFTAEEDGYELVTTYASSRDNVPEYGNKSLAIQPGVTIRCICEYSFRPDGGELTLTISDYSDELVATFDPKNLPGRPGDWTPELNPEPGFFTGDFTDDGSSDYAHVYIDRAQRVSQDSYYGNGDVIRVYFDYTNLEEEDSYFSSNCTVRAYQDGIEMKNGYPKEYVDTDDQDYTDVAPGESISASMCWQLRSDSPIEIVVTDWWSDEIICGCTFSFES